MPLITFRRMVIAAPLALATIAAMAASASAQSTAISFTSGFTNDVIYNGSVSDSGTTSFDVKNNYAFYSQGADAAAPTTGFTTNGVITTAAASYQLQNGGNYTANDALMLSPTGTATGFNTTGTFVLAKPTAYSQVSLLAASANGSNLVSVQFNYVGGTTSTTSFTAADWFGSGYAFLANGRVQNYLTTPSYQNVSSGNPGIYEYVLTPLNTAALQSITFTTSGAGSAGQAAGIFAISGTAASPEPGSIALAGLGLIGMIAPALARRRRA